MAQEKSVKMTFRHQNDEIILKKLLQNFRKLSNFPVLSFLSKFQKFDFVILKWQSSDTLNNFTNILFNLHGGFKKILRAREK